MCRTQLLLFEATLITPKEPFDSYLRGDASALTEEQKEGLQLFVDNGCAACHSGINVGGARGQGDKAPTIDDGAGGGGAGGMLVLEAPAIVDGTSFRLSSTSYFPGNARGIGDYVKYHELQASYVRS